MIPHATQIDTLSDATKGEIAWGTFRYFLAPTRQYHYYAWLSKVQRESAAELGDGFAELERVDYENLEGTAKQLRE